MNMKCNHCGWSNNGTDAYCIKCGNPLPVNETQPLTTPPDKKTGHFAETIVGKAASSNETITGKPAPTATPGTITGRPAGSAPAGASETIDPYRIQTAPPKEFFLQRLDEKDSAPALLSFSTTDELVEFNRANLDAENRTITSKVQARVTFSDGKWHIIDCSEKKSTFIRVAEQHELKDGDILVIGNKRFIFSLSNPKSLE
jgi:hypothetical protein